MNRAWWVGGLVLGWAARPALGRLLLAKFRSDVERLNGGDYSGLLATYAENAVLEFNDGPHRWAGGPRHGCYQGRLAIEEFLRQFVQARVQGQLRQLWTSGPPWALTLVARFDDHADAPDSTRLYENQAVLVVRMRGAKIVHQQDFYVDTQRLIDFERALCDRGSQAEIA